MINKEQFKFEAIKKSLNINEDAFAALLNIFKLETPQEIENLKVAFSEKNTKLVNQIAHKLKTRFKILELENPLKICLELESVTLKESENITNCNKLQSLESQVNNAIQQIDLYIKNLN